MPEYDRIDLSKRVDVNKTNASKKCNFCHSWYFLHEKFNYKPYFCNGCHDLMKKAMNLNDVSIVSVKGSDYRIHCWYVSKHDAINIMKNSSLNEKSGSL